MFDDKKNVQLCLHSNWNEISGELAIVIIIRLYKIECPVLDITLHTVDVQNAVSLKPNHAHMSLKQSSAIDNIIGSSHTFFDK